MEFMFQLGLVIAVVLFNAFFVASEFALVAVRKTRIDELVKQRNKTATFVQHALQNLDTFISATQLGITLASLALGWLGEPAIARFLEGYFARILPMGISVISANGLAIAIAFTFITCLHIIVGELAPKTIALQKAEAISLFIITPLTVFVAIFRPFVWVLNRGGALVLRLIGFTAPSGHQLVHSEEEIKMILARSAEEGTLEKKEVEMVYSVLKLGDTSIKRIMIPKNKIIAFEKNTPISRVIKTTKKYTHSRFPVYDQSIDSIVGFIHIKDIYRQVVSENTTLSIRDIYRIFLKKNGDRTLSELHMIRKIPHVRDVLRIDDVLVLLRMRHVHIAVVDDTEGKTEGLVALEDAVENLTGEIKDEFDTTEL